jgi:cupin 2 domain-containing protein
MKNTRDLIKLNNIYDRLAENLQSELIEQLVENENARIERIVSRGHQSPAQGWYDQDNDEWVMLLKGAAILSFDDGSTINLKPGDYMTIPAHKKHKVDWTDPDAETIWLAVHY